MKRTIKIVGELRDSPSECKLTPDERAVEGERQRGVRGIPSAIRSRGSGFDARAASAIVP